ncbi:MAG: hypothetical protein M5T61_20525 [Acidimicrobiia bacterium]|nr:hypothetical protein [Acidimicrobiia bacterium]
MPKFKVEATLDKPYYLPGEVVHGTVSAQYFFGQSVAGGQVTVTASTYDIGFTAFANLTGFTNDEGLFTFEFTMPQYVVGQPLEQGNGLVKLDVTVVDTADTGKAVTIARTTVVSRADVEVTLVPRTARSEVPRRRETSSTVVRSPMGGAVDGAVTVGEGATWDVALDACRARRLGVHAPQAVPSRGGGDRHHDDAAETVSRSRWAAAKGRARRSCCGTDAALTSR